ncbi:DUF2066 domain-containing protein [Photobacterium sp. DNB23_23_1]|uniref:DUF2066 domain-containing protein n=1 Tax=Photobacterium pectinilyticum TaxID=2906793 RepID=A0ABT1N3Y0_9GAMM|nr:DUF2066 domain-containing protein [Photobacterium sp. ZSDE20]MCQ1059450.1 DUF2066 domain-containing protein [Photobacterium sp. ZSDE20]MDD1825119.1 DUF2066 domain-containing protein [Photobacterium sp. ZSDE20]
MLRIALLFLALLALPLKAATVTNLYQAQVALPDTDRQSEQAARKQALEQVLIKVSGQSNIVENEIVAKALGSSNQYVSQFSYANRDGQRTLLLTFDRSRIRTLLTQANSTFWSELRPSVLVWLVEDANRSRNIIWDQSSNDLANRIKDDGDRRGVPVLIPIGDFEDVTAISTPDIWGGFVQPIATASQRYQPQAVLVVRARQQDNEQVTLNWQLYSGNVEQLGRNKVAPSEGRNSGETATSVAQMIDSVADILAAKYAVQLGGDTSGQLAVVVENIQSSKDFFTLERMITNLTSVAAVNAYRIQGDRVEFTVQLLSTEDVFQRELSQDSRLSAVTTPVTEQYEPAPQPEGMIRATDVSASGEPSVQPADQVNPVAGEASGVDVSDTEQLNSDAPVETKPAKQAAVFSWSDTTSAAL